MRTTGQMFRWGLTCLLLVPVAIVGAWTTGMAPPLLLIALALLLLGAAFNAAALVRGVRRVGSGDLMTSLDGMTPEDRRADPLTDTIAPRQRIIFPDEPATGTATEPGLRRRVGLGAAALLLGFVAFGAWTLAVEQPLAIAQGLLTLDEVYAAWSPASRVGFTIGLSIWIVLSLAIVLGIAVLALLPSVFADRLLTWRRMLATACIAGSVIVVAAWAPHFSLGISLPDDLPFMASGVQSPGSLVFGLTGVALSATAILLTVPDWNRRRAA